MHDLSHFAQLVYVFVVKSLEDDFSAERLPGGRDLSQLARVARYSFIRYSLILSYTGFSGGLAVARTVTSSAYENSLISTGGIGSPAMYALKSVGDRTPPWGTPWVTFRYLEIAPRNSTYDCRPRKYPHNQRLMTGDIEESSITRSNSRIETVSNARDRSKATRTVLEQGFGSFIPFAIS